MILDTVERLPLYKDILPYAEELAARFLTRDASGLPFEVRPKTYGTKPDGQRRFEVHRHTVDLMMCFEGEEIIHICPASELLPGEPLPDGGDGMKLIGSPRGTAAELKAGCFIAIFPGEAHMVGGQTEPGTASSVTKWVVKLPAN